MVGRKKTPTMKTTILLVTGVAALGLLVLNKQHLSIVSPNGDGASDLPEARAEKPVKRDAPKPAAAPEICSAPETSPEERLADQPEELFNYQQHFELLIAPQSTFSQRQVTWKKIVAAGMLDNILADLEARVGSDPRSGDCVAALGIGYLRKCGQTTEIRDQAIFGMKADQTLENAIRLDPSNWEARYMKAAGMSHWPSELGKGREVIESLHALMLDQENRALEPQFALTYLRLGEQYQKSGDDNAALETWRRGARLFPENGELKMKISASR